MSDVRNGVMGLCVGDALGVPVEFSSRQELARNPVTGMRAYGTYKQPAGTWSDDTSMTLCLLDSLTRGLDLRDVMERFADWARQGAYTPFGEAFDIGTGTRMAIARFLGGTDPLDCGGKGERDNGNGALMRILPLLFYLRATYGQDFAGSIHADPRIMGTIHDVCRLTHGHRRSQIACGIYVLVADRLSGAGNREAAVREGLQAAWSWYSARREFAGELEHYSRLMDPGFAQLPQQKIRSSGYVVDTLEAAAWCFLRTDNYRDCVLNAVNLGSDTDTVAAVAGGLGGLQYGLEGIPGLWLETIVRREFVEKLCQRAQQVWETGRPMPGDRM